MERWLQITVAACLGGITLCAAVCAICCVLVAARLASWEHDVVRTTAEWQVLLGEQRAMVQTTADSLRSRLSELERQRHEYP